MSERLAVAEPARLFDFLASRLADWKRNTLRQRLREGCVLVNGQAVTRGDQ
jgi:23S rRNA pseudouridine1911/1915/1917 synthase